MTARAGLPVFLWLSFETALCLAQAPAPASRIDFDRQVHPILAARCLACHSQEKRSGGLALATWADVLNGGRSGIPIQPGKSSASLLFQRITGEAQPRMPLAGDPLSIAEIAVIRDWIDQGARETPASAPAKAKWQAPLTLSRPDVPKSPWKNWDSPLDAFTANYLAKTGAEETPLIPDRLFARRVYLDIWGLLPPPAELKSFIEDRTPGKREALVRRLLADDRRYTENWISFWNDLLRNDDGANYHSEMASRKSITDWLYASLQTNLSYDRFVAKLLNPATPADPEGFLIGVNWRGTVSASQTPAMQAAQNTAQVFLGVNLKCNSCHDSFISKWKLKDAYAMASYFSAESKLQLYRCDLAQPRFAEPAFLFPELNRAPASETLADRRAAVASIFTDPRDGRLPRTLVNRIWLKMMGRGLVENPDEMDGEPWSPELLDWLASDFVEHGYDIKHLIQTIAASRAYQLPSVTRSGDQPREYVFRGPEIRRVTAEEFGDAIGSITGEWHVYQPPGSNPAGVYSRAWRIKASSLDTALGRPIRDQVYSTRDNQATTLQGLELMNGETLTHWLSRGAREMLGQTPPAPKSIFDQPVNSGHTSSDFDIDVSQARKLWLLVDDRGSYSPEKVEAVWKGAELVSARGVTPLTSLKPINDSGLRGIATGVQVKTPSDLTYSLEGKGYTRLRGTVALENREITPELNPQIRFLVFDREPDMERLRPVAGERPLPAPPPLKGANEIVQRVFWYALGRAPSKGEQQASELALRDPQNPQQPCADGLADLLWAVMMKPEFQLIY